MRKRFFIGLLSEKSLAQKILEASNMIHEASKRPAANFLYLGAQAAKEISEAINGQNIKL